MTINGSQCKCLLLDFRQVTKNIFVVFAIRFRVQSHIVDSSESQHCQLVLFVKPGFQFELRIGESRQEREVEHIKQELQIRLTYRYQIRGLFPDMPVGGERHFGCSEGSLYRVMLHISVAQLEIKNGTKCVSSISGESTSVEIDFTYQVGIKDSHRTAGCSLRTEVIDIGYFHSVQIKTVFRRRTTAHNQVVAVADRREGNSRIRLNNT